MSEEFKVALDRFCRQVKWHIRSCFLEFPEEFVAKHPLSIVLMRQLPPSHFPDGAATSLTQNVLGRYPILWQGPKDLGY